MKLFYKFFLFLFSFSFLYSEEIFYNSKQIESMGDHYFYKKKYDQSLFFYELSKKASKDFEPNLYSKLILNYIRLKEKNYHFKEENLKELLKTTSDDFTYNYISMYGAMRFGYMPLSFPKIYKIQISNVELEKKEYAKLIFGSIYFEENYNLAKNYYQNLLKEAKSEEVKKISSEILNEIQKFENEFKFKSPFIAGFFSTVFPGSGYFYTEHYVDGLISFFWNFVFLGGGIYMYNLEKKIQKPHYISGIFLFTGISIYISNIIGSYTSAIRYNNYHIRIFYQKLRNIYFNTDFIEKTSGIEFEVKF